MGSQSVPLLVLVLMLVVFWLVVLRPARRTQQETALLQRNLSVGEDVVLSSGIFGRIESLDGAKVRLEVAPGVVIDVARQVVVRRATELPTGPTTSTEQAPTDETKD